MSARARRFEARRIVDSSSVKPAPAIAGVSATIGPIAGVVINNFAWPCARAMIRTCFSNMLNSRSSTARTPSSAATIVSRAGWPTTSSRTRPAKLRGVVLPTFSPKPREVNGPRHQKCRSMFVMLISEKTNQN
jgi:hypothetical protein